MEVVGRGRSLRTEGREVQPLKWLLKTEVWADDVERAQLERLSEVGWIGRDGLIGVEKKGAKKDGLEMSDVGI